MPNQPHPSKRVISARISRELFRKLQIDAKARKEGFVDYVRNILVSNVDHVELTEADYKQIVRERKEWVERDKIRSRKVSAQK